MKNLLRSKIILLALAPLIIFLLNILLLRFFGVGVSTSATAPLEYLFKLFPPPDPKDMDSYIRHIKRLAIFGEQSSAFFVYSLVLPFIAIGTKRAILKRIVFILAALSIGTAHSFTQQSTIQLQMSLGRLFIAGLLALDAFLFACVLKLLFGKPEWWKAILRIAFAVLVVTLAASYAFEVSAIGAFSMLKGVDVWLI